MALRASLADRIEAAHMERMAAQQTAQSHPDAPQGAIAIHCFHHVFRTGGRKPAGRRQERRNETFIETQSSDYCFLHCATNRSTSRRSSSTGAAIAGRRGLITISHSGATSGNRTRSASRSRRFTRFRNTAFPKARGTVKPSRGPSLDTPGSGLRSTRRQKAAKYRPVNRVPLVVGLAEIGGSQDPSGFRKADASRRTERLSRR